MKEEERGREREEWDWRENMDSRKPVLKYSIWTWTVSQYKQTLYERVREGISGKEMSKLNLRNKEIVLRRTEMFFHKGIFFKDEEMKL